MKPEYTAQLDKSVDGVKVSQKRHCSSTSIVGSMFISHSSIPSVSLT